MNNRLYQSRQAHTHARGECSGKSVLQRHEVKTPARLLKQLTWIW
jgi:hypothetical protein